MCIGMDGDGDARMMETLKKSRIEHKPADHVMMVDESLPWD